MLQPRLRLLVSADFLSDQFRRQLVPGRIPVSISDIAPESVEEDFVLLRIGLHGLGQVKEIDLFTPCQRLQSQIGIKNAVGPDVLQKPLSHDRIRMNLDRITQGDEEKSGLLLYDVIMHLPDQSFGDVPGLFPVFIMRLDINHVIDANVFGVARGRRGTISRFGLVLGREPSLVFPVSKLKLGDELHVMNQLHDAQAIVQPAAKPVES